MARKPRIKKVNCFKCEGEIVVRWVFALSKWSDLNNWNYWTEKEAEPKYICSPCLKDFYYCQKRVYLQLVQNKMRRAKLRDYIFKKFI